MTLKNRTILTVASALSLAALSACQSESGAGSEAGEAAVSTKTMATLIAGESELSKVADILSDAGLSEMLDGNASYILFAPTDAALEGFEADMSAEDARAVRVAILREHMVPGFLTRQDIQKALDAAAGNPVEMQTLGSNPLVFTNSGDTIMVASKDGSAPVAMSEGIAASNGVVFPIDGVLKELPKEE